ncbi:unnamed protein product [Pleuronectes platessa]|uniref:Uncharacterized protein n=1 Tax=Pleuronectes platessa TaxID=8262 RepID=A0A9N7VCT1_PLEPL|nr:unnamed protein product [Pleuronectes platessa]
MSSRKFLAEKEGLRRGFLFLLFLLFLFLLLLLPTLAHLRATALRLREAGEHEEQSPSALFQTIEWDDAGGAPVKLPTARLYTLPWLFYGEDETVQPMSEEAGGVSEPSALQPNSRLPLLINESGEQEQAFEKREYRVTQPCYMMGGDAEALIVEGGLQLLVTPPRPRSSAQTHGLYEFG